MTEKKTTLKPPTQILRPPKIAPATFEPWVKTEAKEKEAK